jgi:NADPH:quinone reductase-like Zn-dependent oxidoreductase
MDLVQKRKIKPVIDEVLPLSEASEGLRRIDERKVFGKVIISP